MEKVAWVLVSRSRLLVARNRGRSLFYLPGGRRQPGESDAETLAREVKEELGATILVPSMRLVGRFTAPRDGALGLVHMTCYTAEHRGALNPASEIAEIAWFTSADEDRVTGAERQVIAHLVARGKLPRRQA